MNVSRRWFIAGLASAGIAGRFLTASGAAKFFSGKPLLTVGILSDIHVRLLKNRKFEGLETFIRTLEAFRDRGVDAVQISGDLADHGLIEELNAIADAWEKVFPGGKAPDGRKVERLFVFGNHDWEGFNYGSAGKKLFGEKFFDHALRKDYPGAWERIFGEEYSPVWRKEVKGYTFVGGHWNADKCRAKNERGVPQAAGWFAENGKTIDPSKPFFYIQHPHPKDTCYGSWAWGHDDGALGAELSKLPNAVVFSGHSHYTVADERSVWQGAFTSIGAASLKYAAREYKAGPFGYENAGAFGADKNKKWQYDAVKVMPHVGDTSDGSQGLLMKVYSSAIVLERAIMPSFESLGEDWVIPLPVVDPKPFAFANRLKTVPAPQFPAGAALKVARKKGMTRGKKQVDVFELEAPPANGAKNARVFEYAIKVTAPDGKMAERRVIAPGYYLPKGSAKALLPVVCKLNAAVLPKSDRLRFEIFPASSTGRRGKALVAEFAG